MYCKVEITKIKKQNGEKKAKRTAYLPCDVTFAQMALILETILGYDPTNLYSFQFPLSKYRFDEISRDVREGKPNQSNYHYAYAPDTYVNFWFKTHNHFNFYILKGATGGRDKGQPIYRIWIDKRIRSDTAQAGTHNEPLKCPKVENSFFAANDPYWSGDAEINAKLSRFFSFHEGDAATLTFDQLRESVFDQGAGICLSPEAAESDMHFWETQNVRLEKPKNEHKKYTEEEKEIEEFYGRSAFWDVSVEEALKANPIQNLITFINYYKLDIDTHQDKDGLVSSITGILLDPAQMGTLLIHTDEENLKEFEKIMEKRLAVPSAEEQELLEDFFSLFYVVVLQGHDSNGYDCDIYIVPPEVKECYGQLMQQDYRPFHKKARWLCRCLTALDVILGSAPLRVLYSMYREGNVDNCTYEDFLDLLSKIPDRDNSCIIQDGEAYSKFLTESGMFSSPSLWDPMDVMFYIPPKEEIEIISKNGYPTQEPVYQELYQYLRKSLRLPPKDCKYFCTNANMIFSIGGDASNFLKELEDKGVHIRSEAQIDEITDISERAIPVTRVPELRGHTPKEIEEMGLAEQAPPPEQKIIPFRKDPEDTCENPESPGSTD